MNASPSLPPASMRRSAYAALFVSLMHIIFGAIVRNSGSGVTCGDSWPRCYGYWFPPVERMDLLIEAFHRHLAIALFVSIAVLAANVWKHRSHRAVTASGGVWNASLLALGLSAFAVTGGAVDTETVRSLHQATGILIWGTACAMVYFARIADGCMVVASQAKGAGTALVSTRAVPSVS